MDQEGCVRTPHGCSTSAWVHGRLLSTGAKRPCSPMTSGRLSPGLIPHHNPCLRLPCRVPDYPRPAPHHVSCNRPSVSQRIYPKVLPPSIYASCNGQPVAPALGGPSQVQLAVARGLRKQTVTLDPGRSFSAQQIDDCTAFAGAMLSRLPCSRGASSSQSAASFGPIAVLQLLYVAREHRRCGGPLAPLGAAAFQLVLVQQLMHKRAVAVAMAGGGAGDSEEARAARAAVEQRAREGKRFAAIKWIQHWGKAYLPGPATWLGMAAAATAVAAAMGYDEGVQRAVAAAAGVGGSLFHCHQSTHSMAAEAAMHPSLHVQATISLHEAARPFGLALRPGGRGPGEDEVSLVQPPLSITFASRSVLGEAPFHDMLGGGSVDMPASQRHLWHGAYPSMPRIPLMVPFNTDVVGKVPLAQAFAEALAHCTVDDVAAAEAEFQGLEAFDGLGEDLREQAMSAANSGVSILYYVQQQQGLHRQGQQQQGQQQQGQQQQGQQQQGQQQQGYNNAALGVSMLHAASCASPTRASSSVIPEMRRQGATPEGQAGTSASAANNPWRAIEGLLAEYPDLLAGFKQAKLHSYTSPHAAVDMLQQALRYPPGSRERRLYAERTLQALRLLKRDMALTREVGTSNRAAARAAGLEEALRPGHRHGAIEHALKLLADGGDAAWAQRWLDGMRKGTRSIDRGLTDVLPLVEGSGADAVVQKVEQFKGWVSRELPHVLAAVGEVLAGSRRGELGAAESAEGLRQAACAVNDALGPGQEAELTRGCLRVMADSMQGERGGSNCFNGLGTTTQNRTGDRAGTVRTLQHHKEDANKVNRAAGKVVLESKEDIHTWLRNNVPMQGPQRGDWVDLASKFQEAFPNMPGIDKWNNQRLSAEWHKFVKEGATGSHPKQR